MYHHLKALRYDTCVTRGSHSFTCDPDHTVLPVTHTQTIPAFTPQPQGITALWPVPTYTACWTEARRCEKLAQSFLRRVPCRESNPWPLDRKSDTLPTAPRRHRKWHEVLAVEHVQVVSSVLQLDSSANTGMHIREQDAQLTLTRQTYWLYTRHSSLSYQWL